MTSNLGSQLIQELSGEDNYDAMKAAVMEVVGTHFRPEFINRVDDVVVFHPLSREHIRLIVDIQLGYLHQRLADRDMRIHVSEAALDKLADAGFDPVYGARPLKRAIQQQVENPLAQEILQGKFKPGDVIEVGVEDNRLDFQNAA
jgi:ATP-dependent Clp protease ATP-binding subunit ClpB